MSCLAEDVVISFAAGQVRGDSLGAIEAHLDTCRPCRLLVSLYAAQTGEARAERDSLSAFGPGDVLAGRYEIVNLIGQGGMGEVYAARDQVLGETVALKTIAVGAEGAGDLVTRLKAEVQLARRVTHRNVCRVFDVGFHAGAEGAGAPIPFFTMELLQGETLRRRLRRSGPLSPAEVTLLLDQMAGALDAAHEAGVLHTDLKSDNVMLAPEPGGVRVVIMDFGLARTMDGRAAGGQDGERAVAGTLGYMAPEQLAGRPSGPATDIYALGIVLCEALTGRLPVVSSSRAPDAERWRPDPAALGALPPGWEGPLLRCLDPSPAARFSRASLLHDALTAGASWRPDAAPAVSRARRRRRGGMFAGAVATAMVIFAVGIGLASLRRAQPDGRRRSTAVRAADEGRPAPEAVRVEPAAAPISPESARPTGRAQPPRARRRSASKSLHRTPPARRAPAPREDDDFIDPFGDR